MFEKISTGYQSHSVLHLCIPAGLKEIGNEGKGTPRKARSFPHSSLVHQSESRKNTNSQPFKTQTA